MNRRDLIKDLKLVSPALAVTNLIPVFECFLFRTNSVTANNDALAIVTACETDAAFAANGKTLLGLLEASSSDEVEFVLDENDVTVKTGHSTFKLPYFQEKDFIFEEPKPQWDTSLELDDDLIEGLTICLDTASQDLTQRALLGVHIKGDGNAVLYSCDGDAVTRYYTKQKFSAGTDYMLPNAFCEAVIKLSAGVECFESGLDLCHEWAHAWFDRTSVYGRLIQPEEAEKLDHDALIKDTLKGKPNYVKVPEGLAPALARARVISDQETHKTVLTVEAKQLKLVTDGKHLGMVQDTIAFDGHPAVMANVSAALVARAIQACDEITITENCLALRKGKKLLQIVSNMD